MELAIRIAIVTILVLILNLPFGYWRGQFKKLSFWWFVTIHLPIPFVVLLRIYSDIGFAWYTYPFLVFGFFSGQLIGKKIYQKKHPVTEAKIEEVVTTKKEFESTKVEN